MPRNMGHFTLMGPWLRGKTIPVIRSRFWLILRGCYVWNCTCRSCPQGGCAAPEVQQGWGTLVSFQCRERAYHMHCWPHWLRQACGPAQKKKKKKKNTVLVSPLHGDCMTWWSCWVMDLFPETTYEDRQSCSTDASLRILLNFQRKDF